MVVTGFLVHFVKLPPPVAIFGGAAICLGLFFIDVSGSYGDWCHVPKYGDFSTQDASVCATLATA